MSAASQLEKPHIKHQLHARAQQHLLEVHVGTDRPEQTAPLTSCMSDELLRMLTFSVLEVPTRVAGKV